MSNTTSIYPQSRVIFDSSYVNLEKTSPIIPYNHRTEQDIKHLSDTQHQQLTTLDKRIKELEVELSSEKTRSDELKDKLTQELDNEKELRRALTIESMRKSEEIVQKEISLTQHASNLEIKLSEVLLAKDDLSKEIILLKSTLDSAKLSQENKLTMLEDQHKQIVSYLNNTIMQLKKENEELRMSFKDELRKILEEKDKQIKSYEQGLIEMKHLKDDYEKNNIILKKEFAEMKIEKDNEMRDRETRLANEYNRLKALMIKEYSDKFASFDNEKEQLIQRYSKFNDEFQSMSKLLTEEKVRIEKEYSKVKNDNIRLEKENSAMTMLINKNKIELSKKEELVTTLKGQANEITMSIKTHFDQSTSAINELTISYGKDKIEWQKEKQDYESTIETLNYEVIELKKEKERNEKEKNTFKDSLKKTLIKIVDDRMKEIKI